MNWQHTWQYNGIAPFREIIEWCAAAMPGCWHTNGHETLYFKDDTAYTVFLLRWS